MSPTFVYDQPGWPDFTWDEARLMPALLAVRHAQGRIQGRMEAILADEADALPEQALLETLTQDVVTTSAIEGETLSRELVRSSVAHRLGLDVGGLLPADRQVDGLVEMVLDATQNWQTPLTEARVCGWQAALFPTGQSGLVRIRTGGWRQDAHGPMQVVSGAFGREKVHYVAPEAARLADEMPRFFTWLADEERGLDGVLKAGVAHFWFITLHPFEDGNGRVARAITDYCLARSEQTGRRGYSLSSQIQQERNAYYDVLEQSQRGSLDITEWLAWYLGTLSRALDGSEALLGHVLWKAQAWRQVAPHPLNERQRKVLSRLLDGFEGKLTSSKWAKLCKCSQDTAARDIAGLVGWGLLRKGPAGGRSTHYELAL